MKCPECQSELVKGKTGYLCINCGYAGKSKAAPKSKAKANEPKVAEAVVTTEAIKPAITKATAQPVDDTFEIPEELEEDPHPPHHDPNSTEAMVARELSRHAPEIASQAPSVHIARGQSVSPTEPPKQLDSKPLTAKTQPHDASKVAVPKHLPAKPVRTATLVVVGLVIFGALAAAYVLPAQAAAKQFNKKLATASSFHFNGSLQMTGSSFLSVLNSNLTYDGNYTSKGQSNQMAYNGTFASRNYTGTLVTTGGNLYSQMTGNDLPFIRYNQGIATYHITPNDWYQTKLDNSLYKYYCETTPQTKYPSALAWYQAIRQVKLQPSALVIYGQSIDGHSTTHLRGSIPGKDLNNAWANINSSLPSGCQWNNLVSDISDLKVTYDLYTSTSYDQIQLHFNDKELGLSGTIITKLSQYNAADTVTAPVGAKSLADIFAGRAAIQTRDFQRRADVDKLKKAIDAYYAANKQTLPASLAKLAPKYISVIPKDPNGSNYSYTVTKKTYTLSATLEDSGQLYTITGP